MKVFGLAGYSGSGKTTLLERLVPALITRGLSVSVIKHAHHDFDIDRPGKDSFRHRQAGACEVLIASGHRWALMHELRDEPEPSLADILERLSPCDLVLVEGYKREAHAKIECRRQESRNRQRLAPLDPAIVAIAADHDTEADGRPLFALDDIPAIADFVARHAGLAGRPG